MDPKVYAGVSPGMVFLMFAFFSAYWAQTTKRSAVLWFFFGLFLAPIAGFVLLHLNSKAAGRGSAPDGPGL